MCIRDRIEAGTFMFAVAAAGGNVLVKNVIPKHREATTAKLLEVEMCIRDRCKAAFGQIL